MPSLPPNGGFAAAAELNDRRERWLNPPEWIAEVAAKVDAADTFSDVPEPARPLIRHSAIMAAAAKDSRLKKRTLTNLYNERPTWLDLAHKRLDAAVCDAYGWPHDLTDEQILERLLALNLTRGTASA